MANPPPDNERKEQGSTRNTGPNRQGPVDNRKPGSGDTHNNEKK